MKTSVLVLGSSGFIGSHLVSSLNSQLFDVSGVDILGSTKTDSKYQVVSNQKQSFEFLEKNNFDVVINCVGSANVQKSFENPVNDFEINTAHFAQLLDILRKKQKLPKVVQLSSAAVYGDPAERPVKEDSLRSAISPYGLHKTMAEDLALAYHNFYSLPTCCLRLFSVYGPGQKKLIFWDIFQKYKSAETSKIKLFGSGDETRDFIFIDDVVSAIEVVIRSTKFKGEKINLASGEEIKIASAAKLFLNELNPHFKIEFSREEKKGDPKRWQADMAVLGAMGFAPKISLEQGLKITARSYLRDDPA